MPKKKNFNKTSRSYIARISKNLFCGYFVIWILHCFFVRLKVLNLCDEFKVHEFTTPNLGFDIDVNMTTHLLPIIVIILVTMLHCNVHQIWKRKITWLKQNFPIWNIWMHTLGLIDFVHMNVWTMINVFCAMHFKDSNPNKAKHSIFFKHLQESTQASMQTCKLQHSLNILFVFPLTFYQIFLFFVT
jgi:hypothetical protein